MSWLCTRVSVSIARWPYHIAAGGMTPILFRTLSRVAYLTDDPVTCAPGKGWASIYLVIRSATDDDKTNSSMERSLSTLSHLLLPLCTYSLWKKIQPVLS